MNKSKSSYSEYQKTEVEILKTRVCKCFREFRPITELCLECPMAIIYDPEDMTSWDCEIMFDPEPYYVPEEN